MAQPLIHRRRKKHTLGATSAADEVVASVYGGDMIGVGVGEVV